VNAGIDTISQILDTQEEADRNAQARKEADEQKAREEERKEGKKVCS
jgi:hypothetical protein